MDNVCNCCLFSIPSCFVDLLISIKICSILLYVFFSFLSSPALQLVDYPYGNGIEVVFAGGRRELMHQNQTDPEYPDKKGDRGDGRDLIQEWLDKRPKSHYVWNKTAFDEIDVNKVDRVIGTSIKTPAVFEL